MWELSRLCELCCWSTDPWLSLRNIRGGYSSVQETLGGICAVCCVFGSPARQAAHASGNVLAGNIFLVLVYI